MAVMHQAQDTFTGELADGTGFTIVKGQYFPDGHELVKRDQAGSRTLFRVADFSEDEPPRKPASRSAPAKTAGS